MPTIKQQVILEKILFYYLAGVYNYYLDNKKAFSGVDEFEQIASRFITEMVKERLGINFNYESYRTDHDIYFSEVVRGLIEEPN